MDSGSRPGTDLVGADLAFRTNPGYDVVVVDRLDPADRQRLAALEDPHQVYGAVVPRSGSGLELRSVSYDLALLLLTLVEPGPLPGYVRERLGQDAEASIRRLVLDGVLEVLVDGAFRSGPGVVHHLARPDGELTGRDVEALRYGQDLAAVLPEEEVAARLYQYGRTPVSPELRARSGTDGDLTRALGIAPGGLVDAGLGPGWARLPAPTDGRPRHWWEWAPRSTARRRAVDPAVAMYKLYVSPAVADVAVALRAATPVLATTPGVLGVKVGAGLTGICRPDKMVVYLADRDAVRLVADRLGAPLTGCRAHGVPFTAAVTSTGVLSWGVDPPAASRAAHARRTSWRGWVVANLAHDLVLARHADPGPLEPWQIALERLRLAGVELPSWTPAAGFWRDGVDAR